MSMISSLIDELNKSADEWNKSNMFELARMCREAADTIWQLRDDLQRANAENAKLRDELAKWERLTANIELPEYPITEFKPKDLERENAKLRRAFNETLIRLAAANDVAASNYMDDEYLELLREL